MYQLFMTLVPSGTMRLGGWNNSFIEFIPSHHVLSLSHLVFLAYLYIQEVEVAWNDISSFIPYARPEQAMLREHEFDSLAATIARGLSHRGPFFGFHLFRVLIGLP